jgi:hypothetical protein
MAGVSRTVPVERRRHAVMVLGALGALGALVTQTSRSRRCANAVP